MTDEPYHPDCPFEYECIDCTARFEASDLDTEAERDVVVCPACGGDVWNLTVPSGE